VVGDTVVWGSTAERASDEMLVFEKTVDLNLRTDWKHDFSSLVAQSTPGCDVWAVLVCGSNDPGNTFEEDTRYMYNVFKGLGYPDSNIFYISPFTSDPGVDRVTSTANAAWAAAQVAANSNASDIVFYFYSAHGNTDYLECYPGSTGGGYVYASTMDGWLDAITARHITVMLQGCRTGSFIGAYSTGTTVPSENDLTGGGETNRIAITATDSTHSSYGGPSSWGSTFTGGYVASFSDPTADTDSNGSISVGEAYDYALAHDTQAIAGNSFPQISPTSLDPDDVFHTCESVDLWISDGPTDTGNNSYDYASTDIWSTLTVSGTTHVDPVSGLINYVHVRVHNLGTTSVSNVDVDLYWADTSTALAWPASFNQIGSTYTLSSIAAGGSAEIVWSWTVDPAWGLGHHFCFVATADATADPMTGGPVGITYVAPYDNNIAQRNVTIVASQAGQMAQAAFQIANIVEQGAPFDLVLDTSTLPSGAMVTLVLPEDLRGRILQKSGGLEGFEANAATGELMVLNERSIIRDIVLDPEERKTVVFRIRMAEDVQPGQEFVVRVFQTVKSEVVGANTFVLRVVPPGDCLTVLTEAVEVFAQIAFRFGIESAAHLVEVIGEALAGEICNEPEAIVEWKRNIFPLEKDVVEALRGRIPDEALRMLYIALDKLASAIDSGDPQEVMIAQELLIKALKNSLP